MVLKETLVKKYSKAIHEGYAAIFAGAGLSRSVGYVDWKTLLKPLAKEIQLDVDKENDLLAVAQYYLNEHGTRATINQSIMDSFTKEVKINENIRILTRLPIDTYWTTNYDTLLEEGFRENNRRAEVKVQKNHLAKTLPDRDAVLYKMHGDVNTPAEAVLTKDDYVKYDKERPLFTTVLKGDLISKTFLFIGFSFEDPNLDYVLSRIHVLLDGDERDHYCFFKRVKSEDFTNKEDYYYQKVKEELKEKDLKRYGIQTVFVNDYGEITDILGEIEKAVSLSNVFISGSASGYPTPWEACSAESLGFHLAKNLISRDYKIYSGFGQGIGSSIINGALDEIYSSKYRHIDEHLCLRPFPQGTTDAAMRKSLYTKYRRAMISEVGIVIILFGNKVDSSGKLVNAEGCFEEFSIAKELGKIIIPIGATGHAASHILTEINTDIRKYPYLEKYIDKLNTEMDINRIVGLVIEIIENQKR